MHGEVVGHTQGTVHQGLMINYMTICGRFLKKQAPKQFTGLPLTLHFPFGIGRLFCDKTGEPKTPPNNSISGVALGPPVSILSTKARKAKHSQAK